ncbi:MAG: SEC-C domain-containing protein [Candidatus Thiodiazotropha sp. (ex Lucinoma aequizonata)]|nr:SEC-C domain-containing protein [Candidatus Thiodiazotropha sp. (ex Lucinoma aequizonata)]MCU7889018.1 SEC-C domain-containing protein [Candidatus Thiodiazotropha sp. (ex Lucinoma aequizonata)]MCU7896545.1 SEC-C domain-containing protein [Candidatus Thiodiazotropha sp. (ex Lucinoma aequizonata)]MCU7899270.1 SEC-C domain-containing protein [Candidatus Thiodiazotropha sp. (ex Lucinoma aequizonata)]MCU7900625.1 SEC-C domain-containing protein [Candidatus Thiodiazotropha sp. (ex Lucinoma aequizo
MAACYCGSCVTYENCCEPILDGTTKAMTAEVLMRARYSAFAAHKAEFLHQSLHPDYRHDHDIEATRRWSENAQWMNLQVVELKGGTETDEEGSVEFIATYKEKGVVRPHHEISRFLKQDGDLYFVDGQLVPPKPEMRKQPKVRRNEPCPCGSGKKFKKCCGT